MTVQRYQIAAIQMTSGKQPDDNLRQAETLLAEARQKGAELAVLPENFAGYGGDYRVLGERHDELVGWLCEQARSLGIRRCLSQEYMLNCSPRVPGLESVLQVKYLENIISIVHGELGGVGVEGICPLPDLLFIGADHIRIIALVASGHTVARSFCRCCFKVVEVACFFLKELQSVPHEIKHLRGKFRAFGCPYIPAQEVHAGLVHAHKPYG